MNCQRIQESFAEHQAGTLAAAESAEVRAHLKTCLTCQREWSGLQEVLLKLERLPAEAPSPRLRANFHTMLDEFQREADAPSPFALARSRVDAFFASLLPARPALQAAFTLALAIAGLAIGARFLQPAPAPAVAAAPDPATQKELAELRSKVESMSQLVTYSLQQQSANTRLQGVLAAVDQGETNEAVLARLLQTLAFDPSTNVRLSALEELYVHANLDPVRAGVLAALPRENSPLVQVAMIDFFAATRDRAAAPVLEDMLRSTTIDAAVREAAQRALVQL
jgi:hypothetical protein